MFRELFSAWRGGAAQGKLIQVLSTHYNLDVSHPTFMAMTQRIAQNFSEVLNEHEMAIQFVAEFTAKHIQADHPRAISEVQKYIRVSNSAYQSGRASYRRPQQDLFVAARDRFGIDAGQVLAASTEEN